NGSGAPEVWGYGLRNPWRFSFDQSGRLFAGDVGQDKYEEIDIIKRGANYGWNIMEGAHCYNASSCDQTGLTSPIAEYDHTEGEVGISHTTGTQRHSKGANLETLGSASLQACGTEALGFWLLKQMKCRAEALRHPSRSHEVVRAKDRYVMLVSS